MPDNDLIARAKSDPAAFGELYEIYVDRIYRYVAVRVGSRTVAEDIVSDIWLKVLKSIGSYQEKGGSFEAWLFTVAGNTLKDFYRKNRKVVPLHSIEDILFLESHEGDVLGDVELNQALMKLTPDQREVVTLRFAGGLRLKDVGDVMQKTEGAVKALMIRALQRLRREMAEGGAEGDRQQISRHS